MNNNYDGMLSLKMKLIELFDLNAFNNAARGPGGMSKSNRMKKNSSYMSAIDITAQARRDKIKVKWPVIMHFIWHVKDKRKDPDNISSGGRKSFLDGMQKAKDCEGNAFLPNDNLNFIVSLTDEFIVDRSLGKHDEYVEVFFEESKPI